MDWELVVSAAGAAGVGGVIGTYFSQAKDRREARAQVLLAVQRLEKARWSADEDGLYEAARAMQAAALIARVPRDLVVEYSVAALIAGWEAQAEWEATGGQAVGINADLADLVLDASRSIVSAAWHPLTARLRLRRTLRRIRDLVARLDSRFGDAFVRAREFLG